VSLPDPTQKPPVGPIKTDVGPMRHITADPPSLSRVNSRPVRNAELFVSLVT